MDSPTIGVPIFPLPNVVLLPHTMMPLHVFEPRYKQLFCDALEDEGIVGVAQLKPGWETDYYGVPPVYRTIGLGRIVWCDRLEDGRYDAVLDGVGRGKIVSETLKGDYRLAQVEVLKDFVPDESHAEVEELHQTLLPYFAKLVTVLPETVENIQPKSWEQPTAGVLADVLARILMDNAYDRQSMLSELDVLRRLRLITVRLRTMMETLE